MSGHNLYLYLYCVLDHAHPVFILCLDQADRTQDMLDLYGLGFSCLLLILLKLLCCFALLKFINTR